MAHDRGHGTAQDELRDKTSTLGEDVSGFFRGGWSAFACCVPHDPEKAERSARRREERMPHMQARRSEATQRRGKPSSSPVVGVGLVLNHTSRRGRNGLFVQELADGPARNSGMIAPGDQLLSVDRHNVETSRIEDLSYLLPGPEGSEVVLTFREESGQTKSVTLVRALPSSFDHFPRYSSVASVPVVPAASCSRSGAPLDGSTPLASDSAPGGVLVGVGIEFAESKAANSIYVSALLPGGPAFESGRIAVTDILVAVDDKDVKGCSLMALADRVLGLPETPITLTLRSPTDASQVKQVTLQRRAAGANGVQRPRSPVGLECASYSV